MPYCHKSSSQPGTLLQAPLSTYISGPDGNLLAGLVPALVSTLVEGYYVLLGLFRPASAAFQVNDNDVLSFNTALLLADNDVSGPGAYLEAYDFQFTKQDGFDNYTPKLLRSVVNQASILNGPYVALNECQRNQYYYKNDTSNMTPVKGNVTFGPAASTMGSRPSCFVPSSARPMLSKRPVPMGRTDCSSDARASQGAGRMSASILRIATQRRRMSIRRR